MCILSCETFYCIISRPLEVLIKNDDDDDNNHIISPTLEVSIKNDNIYRGHDMLEILTSPWDQ